MVDSEASRSRSNIDRLEPATLGSIPTIDRAISMSLAISTKRLADAAERLVEILTTPTVLGEQVEFDPPEQYPPEEVPLGDHRQVYRADSIEELVDKVKKGEDPDGSAS